MAKHFLALVEKPVVRVAARFEQLPKWTAGAKQSLNAQSTSQNKVPGPSDVQRFHSINTLGDCCLMQGRMRLIQQMSLGLFTASALELAFSHVPHELGLQPLGAKLTADM